MIYRLYVETPEFVAGELFARFDEARIADLAVLDREVNGGGDEGAKGPSGGGGGGEQRQGRRQQKVLIDGAGRLVPDVDPESMVLPRSAALARGYGRWGAEEEAGDEEALSPPRMTAAEAAELAGWDEEGSDPADAVFFERSLQPLPPGAHRWWPPPPPPPPGTALPPPLLDGEPAHGPEEAQVLLTKIIKNAFATAPPEGEAAAAPRLEDPFEVGWWLSVCV